MGNDNGSSDHHSRGDGDLQTLSSRSEEGFFALEVGSSGQLRRRNTWQWEDEALSDRSGRQSHPFRESQVYLLDAVTNPGETNCSQ